MMASLINTIVSTILILFRMLILSRRLLGLEILDIRISRAKRIVAAHTLFHISS